MKVIITPAVRQELIAIGDYIAKDNPLRAETFVDELLDKCESLAEFPKRYPLLYRYGSTGVRRCSHGRYVILYRIEPGIVRILHILHSASDYMTLFGGK